MVIYDLQDDFIDKQARAFAAHAESNPRLKYLAEKDSSGELTEAEQAEFFRLMDIAEISFSEGEDDNWWR